MAANAGPGRNRASVAGGGPRTDWVRALHLHQLGQFRPGTPRDLHRPSRQSAHQGRRAVQGPPLSGTGWHRMTRAAFFRPDLHAGLRYERTASAAFKDAEYAAPITKPLPSFWRRLINWICEE